MVNIFFLHQSSALIELRDGHAIENPYQKGVKTIGSKSHAIVIGSNKHQKGLCDEIREKKLFFSYKSRDWLKLKKQVYQGFWKKNNVGAQDCR